MPSETGRKVFCQICMKAVDLLRDTLSVPLCKRFAQHVSGIHHRCHASKVTAVHPDHCSADHPISLIPIDGSIPIPFGLIPPLREMSTQIRILEFHHTRLMIVLIRCRNHPPTKRAVKIKSLFCSERIQSGRPPTMFMQNMPESCY